jgi:phosphomevalonate kinase
MIVTLSLIGLGTAQAKVVVPAGAVIEADDTTVSSVVAMFERAEQAIKAHDLETVLNLYSSKYNYHGLKKDDIRKIWKDLFDEYSEIASTHLFSKIAKVGSGSQAVVEVTCTGHLWAVSKTSNLYVPIDSWHEEVHFLAFEDGAWRIRGNVGESPRVLPFGTAPHPLF